MGQVRRKLLERSLKRLYRSSMYQPMISLTISLFYTSLNISHSIMDITIDSTRERKDQEKVFKILHLLNHSRTHLKITIKKATKLHIY
jgi:hypothetical protein